MIYALEILNRQFVKIGFSGDENVAKRIAELQTGNPFEIKPMLTTYGTLLQEKQLHNALVDSFARIQVPMPPNEWYPGRPPMFAEFLEYLRFGPDAGLAFLDNYRNSLCHGSSKKPPRKPNFAWGKPQLEKRPPHEYRELHLLKKRVLELESLLKP